MVVGLASLKRKLTNAIPRAAERAAREALQTNATNLVAEMKRRVPVDEGDLRDSIGWTWGDAPAGAMVIGTVAASEGDAMRITIYAGNESTKVYNKNGMSFQNAALQEFGTGKMAPNPYFFPSYRGHKRRMKGRVTRSVRKAIRTAS